MFLAAVSGGLVALGPMATATHLGNAFYAFGLILLPTLAFLGLVTFQRALQTRVQDLGDRVVRWQLGSARSRREGPMSSTNRLWLVRVGVFLALTVLIQFGLGRLIDAVAGPAAPTIPLLVVPVLAAILTWLATRHLHSSAGTEHEG